MNKFLFLIKHLTMFPIRIFSKASPFAIIKNSNITKKSAILSLTRFYNSNLAEYSYVGRNCLIIDTHIGRFCSISDNCYIGLAAHPISWVSTSPVFCLGKNALRKNFSEKYFQPLKKTIIEHDVWIGMNTSIISGVHIGTGAIIGAGAVVTKDVEPYSIVAGNPAKLIKYRFDKSIREQLLSSEWWHKTDTLLSEISEDIDDIERFLFKLNQ